MSRIGFRCVAAVSSVIAVAGALLVSCADNKSRAEGPDTTGTGPRVAVGFYPLEFIVTSLTDAGVQVDALTKPGAEPHDLELSAASIAALERADLVVYLAGFQPALDDAVANLDPTRVVDVSEWAELIPVEPTRPDLDRDEVETALDPHFWLDPLRVRAVAIGLEPRLAALEPSPGRRMTPALARLTADLEALHAEMEATLSTCESRTIVTGHAAFGYLAERYGLAQRGIAGLSPEQEPSARDLADAARFVTENRVTTIYFETLVDPAIARTVAGETGAATAVLDPIEGLTDESQGDSYVEVMKANLASLSAGQRCG